MASQPCLHYLPCLGSASSCRRRLPFGSSLCSLKPALRARFMLSLLRHGLRLCLSDHLRPAASSVILARLLACMHAHATMHMHTCTQCDDPDCSSQRGAYPPWLSGLCLATTSGCGSLYSRERALLRAAHFNLLLRRHASRLSLLATQCLQRGQPTCLHGKRYMGAHA